MPLILVVDDEPAIRSLLRGTLEQSGNRVIEAADGVAGLDLALAERPDAVLLDVALPRLSGLEVCRRLREEPATSGTPVLLISGLATDAERQAGVEAGAAGMITKPFGPVEIIAQVHDILAAAPAR